MNGAHLTQGQKRCLQTVLANVCLLRFLSTSMGRLHLIVCYIGLPVGKLYCMLVHVTAQGAGGRRLRPALIVG